MRLKQTHYLACKKEKEKSIETDLNQQESRQET